MTASNLTKEAAVKLWCAGKNTAEIAKQLNCHEATADRIISAWMNDMRQIDSLAAFRAARAPQV